MSSDSLPKHPPRNTSLPKLLRMGLTALAVLAAVSLCWFHIQWLGEPWEQTHAGIVSEQLNYASNAFHDHGYLNLRGQNTVAFLPFTEKGFFAKLHHPQVPYGAYHGMRAITGSPQRGMRSLSLAFLVVALVAILAVARIGRPGLAALSVALFATAPAVIRDGRLVDGLLMAVALIPLALWCYLRWRDRARLTAEPDRSGESAPAYWLYFAAAWLGGMTSWYAYVLVPVLWLDLVLTRKHHSRFFRSAFAVGFPFGISLLSFVAWTVWALPSSVAVEDTFLYLFEVAAGKDYYTTQMNTSLTEFLGARLWNGFGPAFLGLVVLGAAVQLTRRWQGHHSEWGRGAWLLMLAGFLAQVVFRTRAATHDHWVLLWAPGLALMAAYGGFYLITGVLGVATRSSATQIALLATVSALLVTSGMEGVAQHDAANSREGVELAALFDKSFDERDVVLICGPFPPGLRSSARSALMPSMVVELYDWSCGVLTPAKEDIAKLYMAALASDLSRNPWLAELPIKPSTARNLNYGGQRWWIVELDKDKALNLEERTTRPR